MLINLVEKISSVRKEKLIIASGLTLLFAVDPVAAQSGVCGVPNASNGVATFGQLIRGVLVLVGIAVGVSALMNAKGGGSHGKAGSRKTAVAALGLFFVGAALPQLAGWVLGLFGSSLADVGLSCMF